MEAVGKLFNAEVMKQGGFPYVELVDENGETIWITGAYAE
jgi:hypothetical protein